MMLEEIVGYTPSEIEEIKVTIDTNCINALLKEGFRPLYLAPFEDSPIYGVFAILIKEKSR